MIYDEIERLIAARTRALKAGDLVEAERIKVEVLKRRFVIEDKSEGTA